MTSPFFHLTIMMYKRCYSAILYTIAVQRDDFYFRRKALHSMNDTLLRASRISRIKIGFRQYFYHTAHKVSTPFVSIYFTRRSHITSAANNWIETSSSTFVRRPWNRTCTFSQRFQVRPPGPRFKNTQLFHRSETRRCVTVLDPWDHWLWTGTFQIAHAPQSS